MTAFDPRFALEVMRRRQSEVNKRAAAVHLEKFMLQMDDRIPLFGGAASEMDKQIHALWAEADSYDSVIKYLEERIWEEKTFAEKTWTILENRDFRTGPDMVQDVIDAQRDVVLGLRLDTRGDRL
ncbi:hypothetical protein SEA_HORTUS1_24 [Microbacterium phage Hortus1]|nr:hypothetical protein SEA_HORTUS1_24 [Microbacterium phage Hortus1]AWY05595.1 hypothetical protein SEA_OLINDD_24 [Microbacterium phage OlinDD]AWY05848.1 hypothetical protein SEA_PIONEER3_24 [Microbacterium phage Pioneer3]AWY06354.1 hypothetical protein SEA_TANDEM_24 [Microbacterium phage Tandem]QAU07357.1 hypothetical protein SEA_ALLEB_25 [Microbacterium phage Alleb]